MMSPGIAGNRSKIAKKVAVVCLVMAGLLLTALSGQLERDWKAISANGVNSAAGDLVVAQADSTGPGSQNTEFPQLTGRIVDLANLLSAADESALGSRLETFEKKSSDQIVVLTIPSLNGADLEGYANQLFRHWQLGQVQENNGVLFLIAKNDRKMRIEVGYGLEGSLTDAAASLIINSIVVPQFRAGNFSQGIVEGTDMIVSVLSGDSAELEARAKRNPDTSADNIDWPGIIFITIWALLFFGPLALTILVPMFGEKLGPGHYKWMGIEFKSGGRKGRGSSSRGWSSGGGGWSSGGGGGFSGGGGSSGGGGASGGW